jgi:hypothetical protein
MKKITHILFLLAFISLILLTTELHSSNRVSADNSGLVVNNVSSDSDVAAQKFVDQINILRMIHIDKAIFASPLFRSLVDFSRPLPVEDSGRPNPFAPL